MKREPLEEDVSYINPVTFEVECTYNGCLDKFIGSDFEIITFESGKEYVAGFNVCRECRRRQKIPGNSSKAYKMHRKRKKQLLQEVNAVTEAKAKKYKQDQADLEEKLKK